MKKSIILISLLLIVSLAFPFQNASAASFSVNTLDDNNDGSCDATHCSLREAIQTAAPGDTIHLNVTGTIELNGSELIISSDLNIEGPGASHLTISASTAKSKPSRVFNITSGTVTISGVTIANGVAKNSSGGGINNAGTLSISNSVLYNNEAKYSGGAIANLGGNVVVENSSVINNVSGNGSGGGIHNHTGSSLTISKSTFSGNSSKENGGAISNLGTAEIQSSTISGNSSTGGSGGGIYNHTGSNLAIKNTTISDNAAKNNAGGITNLGFLELQNSIVANSETLPQNSPGPDCYTHPTATMLDQGYNLIENSDNACGLTDGNNHNIVGQDPNLGDLYSNGGSTQTHALRDPSPAFDRIPFGVNGCEPGSSIDQRGAVRGGGTDRSGYLNCDIGAFEMGSVFSPTAVDLHAFSAQSNGNISLELSIFLSIALFSLIGIFVWKQRKNHKKTASQS